MAIAQLGTVPCAAGDAKQPVGDRRRRRVGMGVGCGTRTRSRTTVVAKSCPVLKSAEMLDTVSPLAGFTDEEVDAYRLLRSNRVKLLDRRRMPPIRARVREWVGRACDRATNRTVRSIWR